MADNGSKKPRQSVKNIYDENTGFPIMVNLYVIKYIYYHIDKAPCFMDENERGRKRKAFPIYSTSMFPISRQRLDRINKGYCFELTRREANSITGTYGIDIKYFRKEEPVQFDIKDISDTNWKCFYNKHYNGCYELPQLIEGKDDLIKKKADMVENALKELTVNWEQLLKRDDPLFAVCHYFHYGIRFDKPDIITNLKEILSVLDLQEWDKADDVLLKEVYQLMDDHHQYISSLLALEKLRNKKIK